MILGAIRRAEPLLSPVGALARTALPGHQFETGSTTSPGFCRDYDPRSPPSPLSSGARRSESPLATPSLVSGSRTRASKGSNCTFREEVFGADAFDSLEQVREIIDAWLATYNSKRPPRHLGRMPPLTSGPRLESPCGCLLDGEPYAKKSGSIGGVSTCCFLRDRVLLTPKSGLANFR